MRDLMGQEMRIRDYLIERCVEVFQLYGYEPLDSPVMELWETLSAKGGEEVEAETFKFKDKGDREVGLRFDLTVPLARIVAGNPHLPKPFRRYAVGKSWRYDRPQAGRYREFTQADVDIIGSSSPAADAEVVLITLEVLSRTLKNDYMIRVNNRKVLKGLTEVAGIPDELAFECFRAIDKLDKIGETGVIKELTDCGIDSESTEVLLDAIKLRGTGPEIVQEFRDLLNTSEIGVEGSDELMEMALIISECQVCELVEFDMSLARGLDYYTGPVFEGRYLGKPPVGSILGGGRYDHLIERFGGPPTPATGISIGVGRLIDVLLARDLSEITEPTIDVFIAPVKSSMTRYGMKIQLDLIQRELVTEIDLMSRSLGKMLTQADNRGAKYTVIIGPRDIEQGEVSIRNMSDKSTEQVKLEQVVEYLVKKIQ